MDPLAAELLLGRCGFSPVRQQSETAAIRIKNREEIFAQSRYTDIVEKREPKAAARLGQGNRLI